MGFDSCLRIVLGAAILTLPIVNSASAGGPAQMHTIKMKAAEIDTSGPNLSIFSAGQQSAGSHFYIVQFSGPVQEDWKQRITGYGAKLFGYLPEDAFIVKMDASTASVVSADHNVTWVGPYRPEFKLAPKGAITLETAPAEALPPGGKKYTVKVFDGEDMAPIIKSLKALGATVEVVADSDGLNAKKLRVQMDDSMAAQAANIEQVEWVEEFFPKRPLNDVAGGIIMNGTPSGAINGSPPWSAPFSLTGTGQVVGIMDTGLDTGNTSDIHPAFAGTVSNGNSKIKEATKALFDSSGTTFISWSPDGWSDPSGHGTHTSGSLTGKPYMGISGIAYDAELVFQATLDPNNMDNLLIPDLNSQAFPYAYEQGVRVHSNSWGGGKHGVYDDTAQSADTFIWDHPDFVACFAAGNSGVDANKNGVVDPGSITPPATAKNVITVGATENHRPNISDPFTYHGFGFFNLKHVFHSSFPVNPIASDPVADKEYGMAAFSSRGPTRDGRVKPDVVAPGTYVLSTKSSLVTATYPNYWAAPSQIGYDPAYDNYFAADGGTSMATPLTAGAAALVRQYYTDVQGVGDPSAALIKATLIGGAYNMSPGQYGTGRYREIYNPPDHSQGWGRVDVADSINPPAPGKVLFVDYTAGVATGQTLSYDYAITDTSVPVKVTLVWSDYPATLSAAKDLVNDLDLTVTGPDGKVYHGNQFSKSSGFSIPGAAAYDHRNNVEVVDITPSAAGPIEIAVDGHTVPKGPQHFALVIDGGVVSQDATVNFSMSVSQSGSAVTLSATFSLGDAFGDTPMVNKPVTFYDQTGTASFVKKGTVKTNSQGIATLKFTAAAGNHTAYAKTPAIPSIGITEQSTPAVPYTR